MARNKKIQLRKGTNSDWHSLYGASNLTNIFPFQLTKVFIYPLISMIYSSGFITVTYADIGYHSDYTLNVGDVLLFQAIASSNPSTFDGFDSYYTVASHDTQTKTIKLTNTAVSNALISGITADVSGAFATNDNNGILTGVTASSGYVKFQYDKIYSSDFIPKVGESFYLVGSKTTTGTFNFDAAYTVVSIDLTNNFFLASNSSAYTALTGGAVVSMSGMTGGAAVTRHELLEGELGYISDTNELVVGNINFNVLSRPYSNVNSSSPRFVAGPYYYPPCNGGNNTFTVTRGAIYYVPFMVPNTTTFSEARLITKTNGSTNIKFGIYTAENNDYPTTCIARLTTGTSSVIFDLKSTNANLEYIDTYKTTPVNYLASSYGTTRNINGIQLSRGMYFLAFIDVAGTTVLNLNSGVGTGIFTGFDSAFFSPVGSIYDTSQTFTGLPTSNQVFDPAVVDLGNPKFGYEAQQNPANSSRLVPFIAMKAITVP